MIRRVDYEQLNNSIDALEKLKNQISGLEMNNADLGNSTGPAITEIKNISDSLYGIRDALSLLTGSTIDYLKSVETAMKEDDRITSQEICDIGR